MIRHAVDTLSAPSFAYSMLSPILIMFGAALVGVLIEAFLPRHVRRVSQLIVAFGSTIAALVVLLKVTLPDAGKVVAQGTVAIDKPTVFIQATILLLSLLAFLLFAERQRRQPRRSVRPLRGVDSSERVRAGTRCRGCDTNRGLAAGAVLHRRHDALPRGQRPVDAVRCP